MGKGRITSRQQHLVLIVCILASFVAFLDGSVVNVALPAMVQELGGGLAIQQWIVDAYLITLGALMLVAGSFSDLFGRKRVLVWGLIGFAVTSVLCAVAPSGVFLVIMRALQGLAGALLVPSSLALIISTFSGAAQGKAIGSWTAWTGIAFVVGPLLGGFLVDAYSWRLIFAINVLPIAVTLWLMRYLRSIEKPGKSPNIDYMGAILCAVGLGGPVYALIEHARYGWSSPWIYLPLVGGLLVFGYFLLYEKKAKEPMLPLELFTIRNFGIGNLATAAIYAGLSVATFLITVFIQQVGGYSAIEAGLALLPITIIMFFLSSRFGALAGTFGPRLFMTLGPLICGLSCLLMLLVDSRIQYWTHLFPGVVLFGLGLSITVAPLTSAILGSIAKERAGIGSAINNAVARIAGLIAIAALGLVTGPVLDLEGFHRGLLAMAMLLGLGGLISGLGIQNLHHRKPENA